MIMRAFVGIFALLALTACDKTSSRSSSDYASRIERSEILILPAYAEVNKVSATGEKTRQYEYEDHIQPLLVDELKKKLEEKGYRTRILRKKDLLEAKTYRDYDTFRLKLKEAYTEAYSKGVMLDRKEASNAGIKLNGRAKILSEKTSAPVFAYIDYAETNRTSDAQAVDFVAAVAIQALTGAGSSTPPDTAELILAIVDGENDKVLWMNKGASAGGGWVAGMIDTDEEQALGHIRRSEDWALRELPKREDLHKKNSE